jgi:putative flippase GtrA
MNDRLVRWILVGTAFVAVNTAILYCLVDLAGLAVPIGTLLTAEIGIVLRFAANHYWVFRASNPTWRQFAEFHVRSAGVFALWWVATNALALAGVQYLLASIIAVAFTVGFSLCADFLWIWRKENRRKPSE